MSRPCAEWDRKRDVRIRAARDEVVAMFGDWDFSPPELQALTHICARLYAAGMSAGPRPSPGRGLRTRQSSPEEVEAMKADYARPFDPARALHATSSDDCGDDECITRGGGKWCADHGGARR